MTYEEFANMFDFFKNDDDGIICGNEEERSELIKLLEEKIVSEDDLEKLKYVLDFYGPSQATYTAYQYIKFINEIDDYDFNKNIMTNYDLGKYLAETGQVDHKGIDPIPANYEEIGEYAILRGEGDLTPVGYATLKAEALERREKESVEAFADYLKEISLERG